MIEALLFGALISATDPVAIISLNKLLNMNKNLTAVIFGESVLNDAVSIALFKVFSDFVLMKEVDYFEVFKNFLMLFFGSVGIGIAAGLLVTLVFKFFRFPDIMDSSLFFLWVYIPYLISEAVGMSGILAILFLGMVMGNLTIFSLTPKSKSTVEEFFKTFAFVAENFCFVYFGISMAMLHKSLNFLVIVFAILSLLLSRAGVIFFLSPVCNLVRTHPLKYQEQVMIWISGARGAIAFSLALSLPLQSNDIYVTTTQYLVLFTTLVLGIAAYPVARSLEIEKIEDHEESPLFLKLKEWFESKVKTSLVRSEEGEKNEGKKEESKKNEGQIENV
jgi:NhaP-type Na+/H+ or K+/H+ antiporter